MFRRLKHVFRAIMPRMVFPPFSTLSAIAFSLISFMTLLRLHGDRKSQSVWLPAILANLFGLLGSLAGESTREGTSPSNPTSPSRAFTTGLGILTPSEDSFGGQFTPILVSSSMTGIDLGAFLCLAPVPPWPVPLPPPRTVLLFGTTGQWSLTNC